MGALSISAVSKRFGSTEVLRNVSLEIGSGEFFFILGPSGCGKSTLLRIIAGLERSDLGSVRIDGAVVDDIPPYRRGIGMVFQNYALWPHMTVAQNVGFGLQVQRASSVEIRSRIEESLELVRLTGFDQRYPHELSGGQQQRVALARALAIRPSIILLDEPLSNLDARLREEIRLELSTLHARLGITMVYVTHDQDDALTLATKMAILNHGRVEQEGTPRELYERPVSRFVAQFLGDANLIPCTVETGAETTTVRVRFASAASFQLPIQSRSFPTGTTLDTKALLCLRPESLSPLRQELAQTQPTIEVEVQQISYRGAWCDLLARGPEGISLRIRRVSASKEGELPQVGSRLVVGWRPEDAVVIPEHS
jgi:putative spermidine/putrescine transport system ATP-binding protein